ncbi:MAG TPA: orotate phosphoribosyltransferase [Terriglobia bacterium]
MDEQLQELRGIIRERSLRIGDFTLSSGKKSSYYLDCRMTTLNPRGALLIGRLILGLMREHKISADAIGGLTMGADPIVSAVAVVSSLEGAPLPAFIVRKEAKGHGTKRSIEGYDGKPGARVVIVDDVCTTAGSLLTAAGKAEEAGYNVVATFCVVDREEGGTGIISQKYPFYALLTARDLLNNA